MSIVKSSKINEVESAEVRIRNIIRYMNPSNAIIAELNKALEDLSLISKSYVLATTPLEYMRGELPLLEKSGIYEICVYFHQATEHKHKIMNMKFLRQVSTMGLVECKDYVESHGYIKFEGDYTEIKRIAFVSGGMGLHYNLLDITPKD